VLNALRQSEENHCSHFSRISWRSHSAQRLTAIRGKSHRPTVELVKRFVTCSTPYGNQRKITPMLLWLFVTSSQCSTPYGNQRKITSIRRYWDPTNGVLNALRQSEENHQGSAPLAYRAMSCSTPYGNQRKITRGRLHQLD